MSKFHSEVVPLMMDPMVLFGFVFNHFKPVVTSLSTSIFSYVPVGSVETSIVVSSSWWLNTHSSFCLLGFGIGFLLGIGLLTKDSARQHSIVRQPSRATELTQ